MRIPYAIACIVASFYVNGIDPLFLGESWRALVVVTSAASSVGWAFLGIHTAFRGVVP